jgi:3-methyladenine DNA glycosylase/8-oxoguanine DNA glycosylase
VSQRRTDRRTLSPEGVEHLRAADPVLRDIVDRVGPYEGSSEPDLWWSLVDAIVSQQLSVKAAATIAGRVAALAPGDERPTPAFLLSLPDETLRACGLSRAKTAYVKDLAARWLDGTLEPHRLPSLPDEEVVQHLVQVKGIGRWTAEMLLIFSLHRPDVLPVDDLGLRVAVQRAYALPDRPDRATLTALASPGAPSAPTPPSTSGAASPSRRPPETVTSLRTTRCSRTPLRGEHPGMARVLTR